MFRLLTSRVFIWKNCLPPSEARRGSSLSARAWAMVCFRSLRDPLCCRPLASAYRRTSAKHTISALTLTIKEYWYSIANMITSCCYC